MTTLLLPIPPDLDGPFWIVERLPDLIVEQLGVRVNHDHLAKVRRAKLAIDAVLPSALDTPIRRTAG